MRQIALVALMTLLGLFCFFGIPAVIVYIVMCGG
jgi:hypothetical protein